MDASEPTGWFSLMMTEYGYLQAAIDKLDGQRFQIRSWTITAAGVLLTVSISARKPAVALTGVMTTLFFAFLEVIYMQMVYSVIERSNHLESLIDNYRRTGEVPTDYTFGIGRAFVGVFSLKLIPVIVFVRGRFHVTSFYLGLVIVMIAGALSVALI
jgi:hypothetical protein